MSLLVHPGDVATRTTDSDQSPKATGWPAYPMRDPAADLGPVSTSDDDWMLDMRVIESTTPLVVMMCSTSDGCGSSCSTSACATKSSDPT